MSRSHRKTPIFGHTTARSEADDKRLWHKRWRARERDQLSGVGANSDPLPVHRHPVSSTWDMAKDGKSWFAPQRQRAIAQHVAARKTAIKPERRALQTRLLAKWRRK